MDPNIKWLLAKINEEVAWHRADIKRNEGKDDFDATYSLGVISGFEMAHELINIANQRKLKVK